MHSRPTPTPAAIVVMTLTALLPGAVAGSAASPQGSATPLPSEQDVYVLMRDMALDYESARVKTIVPTEAGASVLVGLSDGTMVDVEVVPVTQGWSLRDIFYVAGSSDTYRVWSAPWRRRVEDAERFLAAASEEPGDDVERRARELAPLAWFEDVRETQRLWGLNPVTYRVMQTLRMMPALGGPMGGGINRR